MLDLQKTKMYTDNLLSVAYEITQESVEDQKNWLVGVSNMLLELTNLESTALMAQARTLWIVWTIWEADNNDEDKFLSAEVKYYWGNDFYKWAKYYTQNSNIEPSDVTILNKMSVYRDWVGQPIIEYPEKIYIRNRNKFGQVVEADETKETAWVKIAFDPEMTHYSKLLVSRAKAKLGELTPEAWSAVADNYVSVEKLKHEMRSDIDRNKVSSDFEIYEDNGIIYGIENGEKVAVFQVLFENQTCKVFNKTLCHILKAAGIKVPIEYNV